MTRRKTPKKNQTSHITIRCNNKEYLFDLENNYSTFVSYFNAFPLIYNVQIHHVMFMSNHIHLLVTPTEDNLGKAMSYVLTQLSKYLNGKNQRINHIFGNRYFPSIIEDNKYLKNVIRVDSKI